MPWLRPRTVPAYVESRLSRNEICVFKVSIAVVPTVRLLDINENPKFWVVLEHYKLLCTHFFNLPLYSRVGTGPAAQCADISSAVKSEEGHAFQLGLKHEG